jgi:hypothetical protein
MGRAGAQINTYGQYCQGCVSHKRWGKIIIYNMHGNILAKHFVWSWLYFYLVKNK